MNDDMMFCTKNKLLTRNAYSRSHCFEFFISADFAKHRNSQIFENCQLRYSLNYSNFFQVFVHIFEKSEEHIIRKIFPKFIDQVTPTEWGKNVFAKICCLF